MSCLKTGRGGPLTLFAPGGKGEDLARRMRFVDKVRGTKIGFVYEHSDHFESVAHIRRRADRDAAEVRAIAIEHGTRRATGRLICPGDISFWDNVAIERIRLKSRKHGRRNWKLTSNSFRNAPCPLTHSA